MALAWLMSRMIICPFVEIMIIRARVADGHVSE
jgi:hypothetical protein